MLVETLEEVEGMGRWLYRWQIEYYGAGNMIDRVTILAKSRQDAIAELRKTGRKILEVRSCIKVEVY